MNKKRWFWASVIVFVVVTAIDTVVNTVCLKNVYMATAHLWRPNSEIVQLLPYTWVANLIMSFIFVFIYTKGYEAKPSGLGEGLRFGLLVGLMVAIPMSVVCYATMPIPIRLSVDWFITSMVEFLVAGAIAGLIYKKV